MARNRPYDYSFMGDSEEIENFVADEIHRYNDIMKKVEDAVTKGKSQDREFDGLIAELSLLSDSIEKEFVVIFKFIRHKYGSRSQDLEHSVSDPITYVRAVKLIGGGEQTIQKTIDACCGRAISLDAGKKRLVDFVATRMGSIAPNLSAFIGCSVAAKLVVEAGGVHALTRMPSGKLQLLGLRRMMSTGFAFRATERVGFLGDTDMYRNTPALLRERVGWLLAMSSAAAAGADYRKSSPMGEIGRCLLHQISARVENMKRIGGRRLRKEMNKMRFGSVKLGPKAAGKFKKQRNGGASSTPGLTQELADQFGKMALATQTTCFSPTVEFSKMSI